MLLATASPAWLICRSEITNSLRDEPAVGKKLHWNWIFQTDLLTYVYQVKSRGMEAIDSKFPNGLPNTTLVTDRHRSYFNMKVKDHQVCLAHLKRNAEYLNELDPKQDWSSLHRQTKTDA